MINKIQASPNPYSGIQIALKRLFYFYTNSLKSKASHSPYLISLCLFCLISKSEEKAE